MMNNLTEHLTREYDPVQAIIVYRAVRGTYESHYYLESHNISKDGQILEGKPLLQESIEEIVEMFYNDHNERSRISGIIPATMLAYEPKPGGKYNLVWYEPARIRVLHFATALKIPTAKAWVPPMVYRVEGNSLYVFALEKDERPELKTILCRAPFHNVADDGHVCLGSAKVKKPVDTSYESAMKYWEDLFWLSEFTHLNGAANPTKKPLADVWNRLIKSKGKLKWSGLKELKTTKQTIKSIL